MKTLICLILDRSGSMAGHESDTVGGINAFLDKQKKEPGEADIVFYRFDTGNIERFRPLHALRTAEKLQPEDVSGRGGTPLLDAIGTATDYTMALMKGDIGSRDYERCVTIIVTDGQENDSKLFTTAHIKERIKGCEDDGRYAFIYMGADLDAFSEASKLSTGAMSAANSVSYTKSARASMAAWDEVSASVADTRTTGVVQYANLDSEIDSAGNIRKRDSDTPT